jgi:hypothetical protein
VDAAMRLNPAQSLALVSPTIAHLYAQVMVNVYLQIIVHALKDILQMTVAEGLVIVQGVEILLSLSITTLLGIMKVMYS